MKVHDGAIIIDTTLDIEGLKKEIANLYQTVKKFTAEFEGKFGIMDKAMEKTTATAKKLKIEPTTEGIEAAVAELDTLNAKIDVQRGILDEHRSQLDRVNKTYGETSTQALNLQKKVLNAESAIQKMSKQSDTLAGNIRDAEEAMKDGAEAAGDLGDKSKKSKKGMEDGAKGAGAFQFALGSLIAKGIEKVITSLAGLTDKMQDFRKDMSILRQNASDSGHALAFVEDQMRTLAAVTGEVDSSVEALSNLMSIGFTDNQMYAAIEALTGAVIKFPDTLKIESLADSLQETIATGEATGQFAEMLGRVGFDVEEFNKKMGRARTDTAKTNLALSVLAKSGLAEVAREYKTNNEAMIDAAKAQYDYNTAMAALAEVMQPIKVDMIAGLTEFMDKNRDSVTKVAEAVAFLSEKVLSIVALLAAIPGPVWIVIGTFVALIGTFVTIIETTKRVTGAWGELGKLFDKKNATMLKTTAIIMGVVVALLALATVISVIIGKKNDLDEAMSSMGSSVSQINASISGAQRQYGYANGTMSARRGWNWVDENNSPALLYFNGGEKVFTASQSMAMQGVGKSYPTVVNENYYVTIDGRTVKAFNDVVKIAQGQKQSQRMGYVGK